MCGKMVRKMSFMHLHLYLPKNIPQMFYQNVSVRVYFTTFVTHQNEKKNSIMTRILIIFLWMFPNEIIFRTVCELLLSNKVVSNNTKSHHSFPVVSSIFYICVPILIIFIIVTGHIEKLK